MMRALGIGIAAQFFALKGYSWSATAWPESPIKNAAFVVLAVGSVWAVWRLHGLNTTRALVGIVALSLAAPLVPSLLYVKAREMLTPPGDYAPVYLRGFVLAFACYAVAWFILRALYRVRYVAGVRAGERSGIATQYVVRQDWRSEPVRTDPDGIRADSSRFESVRFQPPTDQ